METFRNEALGGSSRIEYGPRELWPWRWEAGRPEAYSATERATMSSYVFPSAAMPVLWDLALAPSPLFP